MALGMCMRARTTIGKRAMSLMASSLMGPEALEEWKNTGMVSKEKRGPLGTYAAAAAACSSAAAAAQRSAIGPLALQGGEALIMADLPGCP